MKQTNLFPISAAFLAALLVLVALFLDLAAPTLAGAKQKFRVATEGEYPPFNFMDEKGQPAGFDVDVAQALAKQWGVELEIVAVPWEKIIQGLLDSKYDAIIAQMGKTAEREKIIDFTEKYQSSRQSFVGRKGSAADTSPRGLKGKRLATQKDTILSQFLQDRYKVSALKLVDKMDEAYELLLKGETDLIVSDSFNIYEFLKSNRGQEFEFVGEPLPADSLSSNAYIAVRKGDVKLREAINKALRAMQVDGTYTKINMKYFPFMTY